MTYTVELPPADEQWLAAQARAKSLDMAAIIASVVAEARTRTEALSVREIEQFHPLDVTGERLRDKYGLPDLSHLSRQEVAERWNAALDALSPEQIVEAEQQGIL